MSRDFDDPRFERGYTRGYESSYAPTSKPREPTPEEKAAWAGNVAKNLDNARSHVATCIEAMRSAHAARDVAAYQSARKGAEVSIESLRELASAAKERAHDANDRSVQAALANAETLVESAKRDLDAAPPAPVPQPPTLGCATVLAAALPPIENPAGPLQTVFATARHEVGRIFRDMPFSDFVAFEKLLRDFGSHDLALRFRRFGASAQNELLGILNDPKERARARAREAAIVKPESSPAGAAVAIEEHAPPAHADTPTPEPASALEPSNIAGVELQQDAARTAVDEERRIGARDADHAPLLESLDHRVSSALDANDVETALDAVFGKLDAAERLALANRLDAYRPMCGDMIAARIKRLDRTPRLVHLLNSLRDPGPRKLPDEIRGDLEHATGRSLDHVRVHAGADGASMADAHGARAVTIGPDIYMGAGQLDAQSGDGRELIAHEVAHTVQADTHPGPLAVAAKRDGGSSDAAEHEADAFGSRFRSEGAAATWTPSVPVGGATPMRAPAAAQAIDAARAREGFNAKLDNQLSIAARQDANISATAYLHLHMAEVRRGMHLFLASRAIASGDPHVEMRDSFFDALFAAFDGNDTAASVTRLRRWIAPADLYAIVDRNRPIIEIEKAQDSHPSAALDYQHGPKGPAHWSEAVATAIGSALEPRLIESLARMSPRLVAVTARKREAAKVSGEAPAAVRPSELVCAHPLDWHVALAMVGRATPGVEVKPGELAVSPEAQVTYRRISEIEWQGGHGGAWNALRVVTPHDANVEEVAFYIFGKSTEAYRIQRIGPYFVIPEDEAGRIPAAAVFRGIAGAGAHALAFGATAAAVETAEIERALARDRRDGHTQPPAAASVTSLEAQWLRIDEQLQGIALVVRPYGLDASLSGAMARHLAHKADLPTLSPQDAGIRGELFTRQSVLLTKIAAEVGSVASQADEQRARTASIAAVLKAIGATPTQDQATTTTLQRLVHAANLSHLPETGEAAFAEAHTASRDTITDTLEAMLGQAATQIEIARVTMSRSQASSARSTRVFGASFQQRTDALRQRLAELRSKMLHGTADPAEIQALYQAIDGLRVETGMVAQIGQLGQLFDVLDQLESSGWVLFSEALTAKIGETSDDNAIGRLETARRGAFELRSDLQTLHSQWLKVQKGATELAAQLEAGGASNAQDQATATVAPQLDAIRQKLANVGNNADVQAFLRDAYDKVDSAQTRTMIVQIATMIGIAVVSGGVAAMAEGVALGAGATAFGAQLAGLGVETTMFTLLSARLSGESIVHAFASNFAGNLVTFGAIRATNALVAGSAIGRTLAQAKAGERVSRLAAIAAKTAEISAPMLVAIGVQFAQAEAEMLLREGRTLTMDELTATGVQGIAMMIGAAVTHKVLGNSMNEAKAFGADYGARRAQRAHLEKLAREVMAHGDGSQALDLLREARAHVDAEVAKWNELRELPTSDLEARGLSKPVVDTMGENARAHLTALDAMEAGTIAAQLGLDTVVPGHVYAGEHDAVRRVADSYRGRGYKIENTSEGIRVSREGERAFVLVERQTADQSRAGHQRSAAVLAGDDAALAEAAAWIKPLPGWQDVIVHGTVDEFEVLAGGKMITLDHRALAKWLKKSGAASLRIRLLSCEAGKHPKGAAQHLANKVGAEVMAPTDMLHVFEDGSMVIGPTDKRNTGTWQTFKPSKSSRRFSQPKERPPERAIDRLHRTRAERTDNESSVSLGDEAIERPALDAHHDLGDAMIAGREYADKVSDLVGGSLESTIKDIAIKSAASEVQVEAGLRVLDNAFGESTSAELKRVARAIDREPDEAAKAADSESLENLIGVRDRVQKAMLDVLRDPSLNITARKAKLHMLLGQFETAAHGFEKVDAHKIGIAKARNAIDSLSAEVFAGMITVDAQGNLTQNGQNVGTLREMMDEIRETNAAFQQHGIENELVIAISTPKDPAIPREVKILSRTPKPIGDGPGHRMNQQHAPVDPSDPMDDGLVVDIGVGLGDYAREVGGEHGRVVKTEYGPSYTDPAMLRRDLTWQHTAPHIDADSVVILGDALQTLPMLFADRSVKRMFINNINAHYSDASYEVLARGLRQVIKPGGRVEVQWTTATETTGGVTKPRGHITGERLKEALTATAAEIPRAISINENAPPVTDYEYSVEATRSKSGKPSKTPPSNPVPEHRWIFTFGD